MQTRTVDFVAFDTKNAGTFNVELHHAAQSNSLLRVVAARVLMMATYQQAGAALATVPYWNVTCARWTLHTVTGARLPSEGNCGLTDGTFASIDQGVKASDVYVTVQYDANLNPPAGTTLCGLAVLELVWEDAS